VQLGLWAAQSPSLVVVQLGLAALAAAGAAGAGAFGMLPQACNVSKISQPDLVKLIPQIRQANANTWTFAQLPAPQASGSIKIGSSTRSWSAGQPVGDILRLGDIDGVYNLQCMTLGKIAQVSGSRLDYLQLKAANLMSDTTLGGMSKSIYVKARAIKEIPGMADFLSTKVGGAVSKGDIEKMSLADLLKKQPDLANVDLGSLTLGQVPGLLDKVPLQEFPNWKEFQISRVPGLAKVPSNTFPSQPQPEAASGR
jgi:hypothetical protein